MWIEHWEPFLKISFGSPFLMVRVSGNKGFQMREWACGKTFAARDLLLSFLIINMITKAPGKARELSILWYSPRNISSYELKKFYADREQCKIEHARRVNICITDLLCLWAPETNTTLWINYTPVKMFKKLCIKKYLLLSLN